MQTTPRQQRPQRACKRRAVIDFEEQLLHDREKSAGLRPPRTWKASDGAGGSGSGSGAISGFGSSSGSRSSSSGGSVHPGASSQRAGSVRVGARKRRKTKHHNNVKLEKDTDADMLAETDDSDNDKEEHDDGIADSKADVVMAPADEVKWFQCVVAGCGRWRKALVLTEFAAALVGATRFSCDMLRDSTCETACDYCGAAGKTGDCDAFCTSCSVSS
jgi:hypothetical protein